MPSLRAAASVLAPPHQPYDDDPSMLAFYRDLVEPFGSTVDEDLLRAAPHVSHRDLVDHLAGDDALKDARPELIVLASALPDLHPFTMVAPHLNMRFGNRATSFGICGQGLAAPFTALRTVAAFQRAGRCDQALIAVLEQTTLPTYHPLTHQTPLKDSAVGLLLGSGDGPRLGGVETVPFGTPVADRLTQLADEDALLVLGPGVDPTGLPATVRTYQAGTGTYCTSVWLALADHWRAWQHDHATVVLCDTDVRTGRTHLAVLRAAAAPEPGAPAGRRAALAAGR